MSELAVVAGSLSIVSAASFILLWLKQQLQLLLLLLLLLPLLLLLLLPLLQLLLPLLLLWRRVQSSPRLTCKS